MSTLSNISTGAGMAGTGLSILNKVAPGALGAAGLAGLASAPATLGISAIPFAIQALSKIGAGRRTADAWVNQVQKPFGDVAARISARAQTDPVGAAQEFANEWSGVLKAADAFAAEDPTHAKVIRQFLTTPSVVQGGNTLLAPIGMTITDPRLVNGQDFAAVGKDPSLWKSAIPLIATAGSQVAGSLLSGGGSSSSSTPGLSSGTSSTEIPSGSAASLPGDAPLASNNSGWLTTLGKIFGLPTTGGNTPSGAPQSTIDSLLKLGIPLTAAILNGNAASSAANTQAAAADRAAALQAQTANNSLDFAKSVYGDQQAQTAPYREAGVNALDRVQTLLGINPNGQPGDAAAATSALQQMPGYKLNLDEGMKALTAASRGVVSGNTLKAANDFAQQYAGNYFNNAINQLGTVAGFGQNGVAQDNSAGTSAVNTNTNINQTSAQNIGTLGQDAAAARASAYGQGIGSQILNTIQKQQLLRSLGV